MKSLKALAVTAVLLSLMGMRLSAIVLGTIRGAVIDPAHRPVSGTQVNLKARLSEYSRTAQTGPDGDFQFDAVPVGEYFVTVAQPGFAKAEQAVVLTTGSTPVLSFELA